MSRPGERSEPDLAALSRRWAQTNIACGNGNPAATVRFDRGPAGRLWGFSGDFRVLSAGLSVVAVEIGNSLWG
jgi:hypothetical protein